MLQLALVLALNVSPAPGLSCPAAPGNDETFVVEGDIELTEADAKTSALRAAEAEYRRRLRAVGFELVTAASPSWLPGFIVDREVRRWSQRIEERSPLRIIDQDTDARDYSYGEAFLTRLECSWKSPAGDRELLASMARRLQHVGEETLLKGGGIAVYWGLLAFASAWLDRLTRGYMTWRLRFLAFAMALPAPAILLVA